MEWTTNFKLLLFFGFVLEVVTLIYYFGLCNNVKRIKNKVCYGGDRMSITVSVLMATGQIDKARELVTSLIVERLKNSSINLEKEEEVKMVVKPYAELMKEVGMTFDAATVVKIKKIF